MRGGGSPGRRCPRSTPFREPSALQGDGTFSPVERLRGGGSSDLWGTTITGLGLVRWKRRTQQGYHRTFVPYRIGLPGSHAAVMVCIVDDDLSVRRAVRRLLRSAGYTVETYGSAREFLDAEPEGRTALALVDVKMEGMTGFDLQEELAARHSAIPIIFITSFDDAATRERIRRTGWECLVKPFDEQTLLGGVGRVRKPV